MILPNNLKAIGSYAFENCSSLTGLSLPKSLEKTGYGIFKNCTSLKEINFDKETTKLPDRLFSECSSLKTEIQRLENELKLLTQEIETLSKGNDVLDTLSTLVNLGPGLIKYREEKQQNGEKTFCPVCGSAQFDRINQEDILRDAQDYMEQHGLLISEKKKHKDQLEKKIRVTYESMIGICSQLLKDEINKYEKNKMKLIKLQNETADFFHIYRR